MAVNRHFNFKSVEIYFKESLGSGAYGSVYRAKCDHLVCAAKVLHPMFFASSDPAVKDTIAKFKSECELLSSLQHPNIVQFLGEFTNSAGETALVMELMDESLTSFIDGYHPQDNPVPMHLMIDFSHDISLALYYLHNNGIIHRDLSSNNVLLLGRIRAKITDLGVSKLHDAAGQHMTQCPGAPVYMPPEALSQGTNYSEKLDVFSFGVLLIQMASCRFPCPSPAEVQLEDPTSPTGFVRMPVKETERRSQDLATFNESHILRPLMLHCIEDVPHNRPFTSEICEHLEKLKMVSEYIESKLSETRLESQASTGSPLDVPPVSNQTPAATGDSIIPPDVELLRKEITTHEERLREKDAILQEKEKELELATLTAKEIEAYKEKASELESQLKEREAELEAERFKFAQIELELKAVQDKEASSRRMTFLDDPGNEGKVIRGLDPNIVALLSKNELGELRAVMYNTPEPGDITVIANTDALPSRIRSVLTNYQKLANSSNLCVDFLAIPSCFPGDELEKKLEVYNSNYNTCHFSVIQDLNALQVMALQPAILKQAKENWERELKHTIYMSGCRKLLLKKTDITKEPVTVLVNAANRRLGHSAGLARALNAASGGKMQSICDEYIRQNGILDECGIARTRSAGELKCQWVLHAVSPDGAKYSPPALQDKMRGLVTSCLKEADKIGAFSIAIPPLGTGHHHVDKKLAANAIIAAVLDYDYLGDNSLREVIICAIDDRTFSDFAEIFAERRASLEYQLSDTVGILSETPVEMPVAPASTCRNQ
ncbi:PREDICTED: STE20-like serine/threonine-protein kinase [Amphimedon queenslandica]|uniref:Protein kinase domain-containing protein n=1 Tax=Amphimedon queenslandica TaxID=400682 RepID=A0A1X7VQ48_AMPQE|nr:PREDICTED: STE20-like serine/threonine-protein kinase [Amphimedon queenslandica]|eukprot:XP_011409012.1 PREDICTED: STE20-like serine/threonine-protein kinase [Amphimedon queenslandica]